MRLLSQCPSDIPLPHSQGLIENAFIPASELICKLAHGTTVATRDLAHPHC